MIWDEKKQWYIGHSLLIAIIVSILSIFLVFHVTATKETIEIINRISPFYLLLGVIFHILGWIVWGVRIKVLSDALGGMLTTRDAVRSVVASLFGAAITPSHAGGEPVRAYLIAKKGGVRIGDAGAIVLFERLLDLLFILLISPIAIFLLRNVLSHTGPRVQLFITASAIMLIFIVIIIIHAICRPAWIKNRFSLIYSILRLFMGGERSKQLITRISAEVDVFLSSLRRFIRVSRARVFFAWLCTILYWSLEFMIPCLILMGLGEDPEVLMAFASQVVLMILVFIPLTPGSSGVAELGFTTTFSFFVKTSLLGVLVLTWRFITYYMNIIAGSLMGLNIVFRNEKR